MFLLAASLFVFTPAEPSALAHERTAREVELAARPLPKSIWRLDADGAATHLQSTLVCPSSAGSLQRSDLVPYDGFGFDVGCNFSADGPVVVTLYLTHRHGATLQEHFDAARSAITMMHPTAKPIDGPVPMPAGDIKFLSAAYQIGDLESGLWVADVAGWTLKFRVSFDPRKRADAMEAMSQLAGGAQRTAGDHLSQCAGAAPVVRNGERITDRELLARLSLIAGMSEQAGAENVTPLPKNERWCAEDTARSREAPMIHWRNILNDGADGPLDRLSLMTMEEPPIWLLSANASPT